MLKKRECSEPIYMTRAFAHARTIWIQYLPHMSHEVIILGDVISLSIIGEGFNPPNKQHYSFSIDLTQVIH